MTSSAPSSTKPDEARGGPLYRKPRADVFTMLLIIALLAILIAIAALYAIMKEYDFKFRAPQAGLSAAVAPASLQAYAGPDLLPTSGAAGTSARRLAHPC
jgi:hypothetical protein